MEKTVIDHRGALAEPEPDGDAPAPVTPVSDSVPAERRLVVRTRERHAAVQQLLGEGWSISAICRALRLDRKTVQRFARAQSVEELLVKARNRGSLLDPFKPYLHERFNAGNTDAARLAASAFRYLARDQRSFAYNAERHVLDALAIRAGGFTRSRVFDQIGLARARFMMGEPEQACEDGSAALDMATEVAASRRVTQRLSELITDSQPYEDVSAVRDLRERLHLVTAA